MAFTSEQRRLYRQRVAGDPVAIAEFQNKKYNRILDSEKRVCFWSQVVLYRNLTLAESSSFYEDLKEIEMISPLDDAVEVANHLGLSSIQGLSSYKNAKRNFMRHFTCHLGHCPSCYKTMTNNNAVWFKKLYFISYGFLKVCRNCAANYERSENCICVYYRDFMDCYQKDKTLALKIFDLYINRGLVWNPADVGKQQQADEYMRVHQRKIQDSFVK